MPALKFLQRYGNGIGLCPKRAEQSDMRGCDRTDRIVGSRAKRRLGVRLSGTLRAVGNPEHGRQAGGQAACSCMASAQHECALMPWMV